MFVEKYLKDLRESRFAPHAWGVYVWRCFRRSVDEARSRPVLMAHVGLAGLLHLVVLFLIAAGLAFKVHAELAQEFFTASAWWLLGGLAWISLHLGMFRRDDNRPHSGLGLPNFLTLGRVLCIPAFLVFITRGHVWLALAAFALGGLTDVADGVAARRLNITTKMGKVFDPLVDILFNFFVAYGLTRAGYIPDWLMIMIAVRYGLLLVGGAGIYFVRGPVRIRPTILGKTTGVVTTALLLAVVLCRELLSPEAADSVVPLLHSTLGFVLALTLIQVLVLGWTNIKELKGEHPGDGKLAVLTGEESDQDAG